VRGLAFLLIGVVLLAGCAGASVAPTSSDAPDTKEYAAPTAIPTSVAKPTAQPTAQPTVEPRLYAKLRVFIASESTDSVVVLEG